MPIAIFILRADPVIEEVLRLANDAALGE